MRRNASIEEISDGRLYRSGDLVRADTFGCEGCSDCCRLMTDTIFLDPLDLVRLCRALSKEPEALSGSVLEFDLADGLILPRLKQSEEEKACVFLNGEGRCSVHEARPGFCRLFPLGRYYHDGGFSYILQVHECSKKSRGKVKVKNWLSEKNLPAYEAFVLAWHDLLEKARAYLSNHREEETVRALSLFLIRRFYLSPWPGEEADFYPLFKERVQETEELLGD